MIRKDKTVNEHIRETMSSTGLQRDQFKWYEYMKVEHTVKKVLRMDILGKKKGGRPEA